MNWPTFNQALAASDCATVVHNKRPRGGGGPTTLLLGYTLPNHSHFEQQTFEEFLDI